MLNTLMLLSINGPDLYSPECNELIESAVLLWNEKKTEGNSLLKVLLKQNQQLLWQFHNQLIQVVRQKLTVEQSISDESHVILALGLFQEDSECADSDFYSEPEFD